MISIERVVDLTRPIGTDISMWPGTPQPAFEARVTVDQHGFFARLAHLWEHTGTHLDAPAHFIAAAATVDALPADKLVCPAVLVDVADRCAVDRDYAMTVEDVERFELAYGRVPAGGAVLVRTGWDAFLDDRERYMGPEGDLHFPGVGEEAARFLVVERGAIGIGIDTLGIDPGKETAFSVHRHGTLPNGAWNLEGLVNLAEVPATGFWITVGVLPLVGGSGAPARVFALIG
jgi:kynurenine formamidase